MMGMMMLPTVALSLVMIVMLTTTNGNDADDVMLQSMVMAVLCYFGGTSGVDQCKREMPPN
eukprot:3437039-Pyramimonas_sp.AAC.1